MLLLPQPGSIILPGVTDFLGDLPTLPPFSSVWQSASHQRLKIVNSHHPNSMALRTGACDPILVSFSRKVLFFIVIVSAGSLRRWSQTLNFVFSAVGGHQFLYPAQSLPHACVAQGPTRDLGRAYTQNLAFPLSGSLLPGCSPLFSRCCAPSELCPLVFQASKIVDFCA